MRVLTCEQMRLAEEKAAEGGLVFLRLMENAGSACAKVLRDDFEASTDDFKSVAILCGNGKNGGDGFVIARKLCDAGFNVSVLLTKGLPKDSDADVMFKKLKDTTATILHCGADIKKSFAAISEASVVVDCIFGTGFRGKVDADTGALVSAVNEGHAQVYAVDLPSGADCDTGKVNGDCIQADKTLAVSSLKPAHILTPSSMFCGKTVIVDIGIPKTCYADLGDDLFHTSNLQEIADSLIPLSPFSHKGLLGHVVSVCGSRDMPGSAVLAARAISGCGAGLVTAIFPDSAYAAISSKLTEPLLLPLPSNSAGTFSYSAAATMAKYSKKADCILLGCGLGVNADTTTLVLGALRNASCPVVLDADALNILSIQPEYLDRPFEKHTRIILTPHPGEMARLTGLSIEYIQNNRLKTAKDLAEKLCAVVVLKGANTVIAGPGLKCVYVNPTGNPGMAKGGSGDMLAGMIAAFVAQGMTGIAAARAGAYIHGLCGDDAVNNYSVRGLTPSLCLKQLPHVMLTLEKLRAPVTYNNIT